MNWVETRGLVHRKDKCSSFPGPPRFPKLSLTASQPWARLQISGKPYGRWPVRTAEHLLLILRLDHWI